MERKEGDIFNERKTREDGRWIVETKVGNTEIDHEINLVREKLCILEVSRSLAVLGSIPPCD